MNWYNLKRNRCPQCNLDLMKGLVVTPLDEGDKLLAHKCGFKIREERYKEIVAGLVSQELDKGYKIDFDDENDNQNKNQ